MKKWLGVILLPGLLALCAPNAEACTCIMPEVKDALNRADVVFLGKVKEVREPKTSQTESSVEGKFYTIKFEVEKIWKGAPLAEFSVLSAQGANKCFAYPPVKKGEEYLVFADPLYHDGVRQIGWSIITTCSRTALSSKAATDIRRLNSYTSPLHLTPAKKPN